MKPFYVVCLVLVCAACGSLQGNSSQVNNTAAALTPPPYRPHMVRRHIVASAKRLLGTPYKYGGATAGGLDCSGLVYLVHRKQGLEVPRSSVLQFNHSRPIPRNRLKPGDLVFFRLEKKISHVGIYIGDNRFIHAPSSGKQVRISSLDNPYWRLRLVRGGRFI